MNLIIKEAIFKGEKDLENDSLPVRFRLQLPGEKEKVREMGPELSKAVFDETKVNTATAFMNIQGLDPVSAARVQIETARKRVEAIAHVLHLQKRLTLPNLCTVIDQVTAFKRKDREQLKHILSQPATPFDAEQAVASALGPIKPQVQDVPAAEKLQPVVGIQQEPAQSATVRQLPAVTDHKVISLPIPGQSSQVLTSSGKQVSFTDMNDLLTNHPDIAKEAFFLIQYKDYIIKGPDGNLTLATLNFDLKANFFDYARTKIFLSKFGFSIDHENGCYNILNVLIEFLKAKNLVPKTDPHPHRAFMDFDKALFQDFDDWMMEVKGYERSTASNYISTIRSYFHAAEDDERINAKSNPFRGKNKFIIPTPDAKDRSVLPEDMVKLLRCTPNKKRSYTGGSEEWAMDFFMMSTTAYGINLMDLLSLKKAYVKKGSFTFKRAKIEKRGKTTALKVTVLITSPLRKLMEKWKSKNEDSEYYFPYLDLTEEDKKALANVQAEPAAGITIEIAYKRKFNDIIRGKVDVFINKMNRWLTRLTKRLKFERNITVYSARHTFANAAINKGIHPYRVMQALGQKSFEAFMRYANGIMGKDDMNKMLDLIDEDLKHITVVEEIEEELVDGVITIAA